MNSVETVRRFYEAFASGDKAALRAILAPDVEWIQCAGFPGGGRRTGIDEVFEKVFSGNRTLWRGFRADVQEVLDAGTSAVALGEYSGIHSVSGRDMRAVFAHVYDLRDGRIVRFRQITDTAPMVAAMAG